jgi:Tfp pilus assembly protein FimT
MASHPLGWRPRLPPRGLTLIDIFTTLALLALLATLALPSMGRLAERHRLSAAAEGLAADLALARLEAAHSGQTLYFQAETAQAGPADAGAPAGWCWAVATTADCGCATSAQARCLLHRVTAANHPGVRLTQALHTGFEPGGTRTWAPPAANPVQAELASRSGDRLRVSLGALGRASICAPGSPGPSGQHGPSGNVPAQQAGPGSYPRC